MTYAEEIAARNAALEEWTRTYLPAVAAAIGSTPTPRAASSSWSGRGAPGPKEN